MDTEWPENVSRDREHLKVIFLKQKSGLFHVYVRPYSSSPPSLKLVSVFIRMHKSRYGINFLYSSFYETLMVSCS
jgi:hypothetical protein